MKIISQFAWCLMGTYVLIGVMFYEPSWTGAMFVVHGMVSGLWLVITSIALFD